MRTITKMREDIEALWKKIGDMRAACLNENRDMDEEELQREAGYMDEIDRTLELISAEERRLATEKRLEAPEKKVEKPSPRSSIKIEKDEQEKRDKFQSFGEQLTAVYQACRPGGFVDPRLASRAATGLQEGRPSDGGFLVQTDFASRILENVWTSGLVTSRVTRYTLSGNSNALKLNGMDETSRADGSRAGGIRGYWAGEADEKTSSKPKFRQIELKLNKLIGLCYATDELLEDASALESVITTGFTKEFDFKITDAIINGTGAGQPLGILSSGCLVSVTKEAGQAADTIVYENIVKMWARMMASSMPNAVWLVNQDCLPQLHTMSLAVGTGGVPVYMPAGGASASPYGTLYGRPVLPIEQCQTLGTAGDIILADLAHYLMIDKGGLKRDVSIHVRFVYDESCFRFVLRTDGQPELASAITPFNGTDTLSHFVTIADRD